MVLLRDPEFKFNEIVLYGDFNLWLTDDNYGRIRFIITTFFLQIQ